MERATSSSELPAALRDPRTMSALDLQPLQSDPRNLREVIPAGKGRVDRDEYLARVRRGQASGMQSLFKLVHSERSRDLKNPAVVCIVGGGPSLTEEIGALRRLIKRGAKVVAVNKSHDWLLKRGLRCDYAALLDPKECGWRAT